MHNVLQLDPRDNVLIALTELQRGETVEHSGKQYTPVAGVPAKHKFATEDLPTGASVTMYGVLVGKILRPVRRGELLTSANVHHEAAEYHERAGEYHCNAHNTSRWKQGKFMGYRRSDGQVGTRNFWLVVPLVFCENRNILNLKQAFEEELGFATPQPYREQVAELAALYREGKTEQIRTHAAPKNGGSALPKRLFQNLDGIRFLLHEGGCGGT